MFLIILKSVLIILAAVIIIALLSVLCFMPGNKRAMLTCADRALSMIRSKADVTEKDTGKYRKMRLMGIMNFKVHQYDVKNLGNLSIMTMNAGVMQMVSVILTPLDKDIPLISADYMYIFGKRTSYLECYDLVVNHEAGNRNYMSSLQKIKEDYRNLDTITPSSAWYDSLRAAGLYMKGKRSDDGREEEALVRWIGVIMSDAENKPLLSEEEKQEKISAVREYTDGLVNHGGVSTDLFVKALGKEETKRFFDHVLFGTEGCR